MNRGEELARQTTRQQMIGLLSGREHTALELSAALRIREKEVYEHLAHVRRSVVSHNQRLVIQPARCLECRFTFRDRRRLTTPGKCPRCKGEHIQDPKYRIASRLPIAEKENDR